MSAQSDINLLEAVSTEELEGELEEKSRRLEELRLEKLRQQLEGLRLKIARLKKLEAIERQRWDQMAVATDRVT